MDKSEADAGADGGADAGAVVALIGDLVSSRQAADRAGLQRAVGEALAAVEAQLPAVQPLEVTIGDEFQAVYATVADAARAALLLRLRLLPVTDTRYGLGRGSLTVFDRSRTPFSQDGPAWWAARAAIDTARERSLAPRTRTVRTWFAAPPAAAGPGEDPAGAVNAFLVCRDDIVGRMNARSQRLLALLLAGQQQEAMARAEGVSQSAVSQALNRSGAYAVLRAGELLATATSEPMGRATSEPMGRATSEPMGRATSEPMGRATSEGGR